MEVTESTIYWITRLDSLKETMGVSAVLGILTIGICVPLVSAMLADVYGAKEGAVYAGVKRATRAWLPLWMVFIIIGIGSLFVPTTKEMCAIKVLPLIINDNTIQEIPSDIAELAHEWLEELKPKKN